MIIITHDKKIIFTLYNSFQIRFDCPFAKIDSVASTLKVQQI